MTSRERILAALRGGQPDRVPVWAWGIHPWLEPVHPSVQPVVDAYLERADLIHWWSPGQGTFLSGSDRVSVQHTRRPSPHRGYEEDVLTYATPAGDLTEVHLVSLEGRPGYCIKHVLEDEGDVERLLSVPYVPVEPDCAGFFAQDRLLGARGLPIVSVGADPMYAVNHLIGSERFAIWSVERRDLVSHLIATFAERLQDWLTWVLARGVGPLYGYVGPELCIPPLQSPRDFEEWVVEPDRRINDAIRTHGGIPLVHCHGRLGPVLEGFVRMHALALHPIEPPPMGDVPLAAAKERVGDALCIVGNVQEHDIWTLPTAGLCAVVAEAVRDGMPGGRFILSPTGTPFGWPTMTPLARDNWIGLLDTALQHGRY